MNCGALKPVEKELKPPKDGAPKNTGELKANELKPKGKPKPPRKRPRKEKLSPKPPRKPPTPPPKRLPQAEAVAGRAARAARASTGSSRLITNHHPSTSRGSAASLYPPA